MAVIVLQLIDEGHVKTAAALNNAVVAANRCREAAAIACALAQPDKGSLKHLRNSADIASRPRRDLYQMQPTSHEAWSTILSWRYL